MSKRHPSCCYFVTVMWGQSPRTFHLLGPEISLLEMVPTEVTRHVENEERYASITVALGLESGDCPDVSPQTGSSSSPKVTSVLQSNLRTRVALISGERALTQCFSAWSLIAPPSVSMVGRDLGFPGE